MKTLLIDPFTKTVTEHEIDGSLESMYALLQCGLVESVSCNDAGELLFPVFGDCLFVDEEGLFVADQEYFIIDGKPLAGRALTIGCDDDGETVPAQVAPGDLAGRIVWADLAAVQEFCAKRGF